MLNEMIKVAQSRLDNAMNIHNPAHIWLAYSGGSDSAVVLELFKHLDVNVPLSIMTIDTGLSSSGHIDKVKADINRYGGELQVFVGGGLHWWVENVYHYGYAYTPNQHSIYYRSLKERAIDESIRLVKTKYHQRVLCVTGVRRAESFRRKDTKVIYHRKGARVTLNLIADYSGDDKQVILDSANWYEGKTTEDCMCNWHGKYDSRSDMNELMKSEVEKIDKDMMSCGLWTYGSKPSKDMLNRVGKDQSPLVDMPEDSFCLNCQVIKK